MHGLITISEFRVKDNGNNDFDFYHNAIHNYNSNIDNNECDDSLYMYYNDNDDHTYLINICYCSCYR